MPNYTISIKAAVAQELVEAFKDAYDYQATIPGAFGQSATPNPESAADFTKRKIMEFPKEVLRSYRAKLAREAATLSAVANDDISIS